jgi:heterodisulfide reductase subunit A
MTAEQRMTASVEARENGVLVVGGGIAGMGAAMHLGEVGYRVHLVDSAPAIGGSMHLLDHTFPTNSCGLCLMLPQQPALCPTFECDLHEAVRLVPYTEVVSVEEAGGGAGDRARYEVTLRHKARLVDVEKCNGCGDCAAVCPEARPHDHEGWLSPVKAIYRPAGQRVVPDTWVIDREVCTRCGACVPVCPTGAIDLEMGDEEEKLGVGAILLTPGFAAFDARLKGEYGYGVYDNVLTALEFERMVSLAGSRVARLARPSDGGRPKRVAFVQCVGSRDNTVGAGYCSSACCMYTAKQVALAKRVDPGLEATVFFMDLRASGKNYEAYVEGVRGLPGVTYRRAMPSSVYQQQQTRELRVSYAGEDGRLQEEGFDLVVLAVGLAPPAGMQALARELGVELNEYGFAVTGGYEPTRSSREGVFVAGAFREPKDIPETVAEAAGAAAEVAAYLRGGSQAAVRESQPAVRDVTEEEPRVGVFVCECNGELGAVGVPEVVAWAEGLPGVVLSQAVGEGCSAEGRAGLRAAIEEAGLNRVVVAGCSERQYGGEFEGLMRGAGLDPRLMARVNLREQVVYPHRSLQAEGMQGGNGAGLTGKAKSLVGMAVAGLRSMGGVEALGLGERQELTRRAVVVGGGAAGMTAALELAALGIPVELVEREAELGGQWRHIRYQAEDLGGAEAGGPQAALRERIERVQGEERIRVHLGAQLTGLEGRPGQYRSVISKEDGEAERVEHGVVVVATGGRPAGTGEYLYGQDPRVLTQRELEEQIAEGTLATVRRVVMIQCVGSREAGRPYCSRVCCTQAVKNALKLKEVEGELEVYVLYREVRTYGFREAWYQAARDAGVVFVRYEVPGDGEGGQKPRVEAEGNYLRVVVTEPVTGQPLELTADLVVLSTGIEAEEEEELAGVLGVALDEQGFFVEEQAKMKPLDVKGGVYLAGLAHSPRFLEETIVQAQGAAMRAAAYLALGEREERPTSVWVNERLCSFCGLCVEACPYEARVMNYDVRVAEVDYGLCQGCGVCAMVCPNKATLQKAFEHKQLMATIDMALL